jgi:hypothetical protein
MTNQGSKSSGSGLENLRLQPYGICALTMRDPSIRKIWHWLRRQAAAGIVRPRTGIKFVCLYIS